MKIKNSSSWESSTGLARAILHDRAERRKWLGRVTLVPLSMLALGLWVLDSWIWASPWRVLLWWGSCAVATCMVLLFALYDALAAVREEREKVDQ
jgi:polyferredoxin